MQRTARASTPLRGNATRVMVTFTLLLLVGCDQNPFSVVEDRTGSVFDPPAVLLQSRQIDIDALTPVVQLGGSPVVMLRSGDRWSGQFTLPDDRDYVLEVAWQYDFRGQNLMLAEAPDRQINRRSARRIEISDYGLDFDFDNDGISNFTEIDQRSDPTDPNSRDAGDLALPDDDSSSMTEGDDATGSDTDGESTMTGGGGPDTGDDGPAVDPETGLAPGQRDCRQTTIGLTASATPIPIDSDYSDTLAITRASGLPLYVDVFAITTAGTFSARQVGGTPIDPVALLFDADPVGATRALAEGSTVPVTLEVDLEPGLYCLAMAVRDVGAGQLFSDLVVEYGFDAR